MKRIFITLIAILAIAFMGWHFWWKPYQIKQDFLSILEQVIPSANYQPQKTQAVMQKMPFKMTFRTFPPNPDAFVLWTFVDNSAPPPFQNQQIFVHYQQCFTTVPATFTDKRCRSVNQQAMEKIIALHELGSQKDEKKRPLDLRQQDCKKWAEKIPPDVDVLQLKNPAGRGKTEDFQLRGDDSGGNVLILRAKINYPHRPVVLELDSYYPAIWYIQSTTDSQIVGVWARGYHLQKVVGLAKEIPVLTTFSHQPRCHVPQYQKTGQQSRFTVVKNQVQVGGDVGLFRSEFVDWMALRKSKNEQLAGPDGLKQLVEKGILRHMTNREYSQQRQKEGKEIDLDAEKHPDKPASNYYFALQKVDFPPGMSRTGGIKVYLPEDIPLPDTDISSVTIILLESGACYGFLCDY